MGPEARKESQQSTYTIASTSSKQLKRLTKTTCGTAPPARTTSRPRRPLKFIGCHAYWSSVSNDSRQRRDGMALGSEAGSEEVSVEVRLTESWTSRWRVS